MQKMLVEEDIPSLQKYSPGWGRKEKFDKTYPKVAFWTPQKIFKVTFSFFKLCVVALSLPHLF